jgi:2,3-dihydroxybenzoate-AMP ligase
MLKGCVPWPKEFIKRYQKEGYWEGITLGDAFETWVDKYSSRPALFLQGKEITYRQMDEYATRIAYQMSMLGVKTYDRVIMQLFNVPELVYLFYACMKIGAIPICTLPTHRFAEISFIAKKSAACAQAIPAGMVKDFDFEGFAGEVKQAVPSLKYILTAGKTSRPGFYSLNDFMESDIDLNTAAKELKKFSPKPSEPAVFQLSGGTTGVPKIIPRTHNDYHYNTKCCADAEGFDENTKILAPIPLIHNAGMVCGMLPVHSKGGAVVLASSISPEALLQAIAENRANILSFTPVLINRLLELPENIRIKYDTSSLKGIMGSWNPVDPIIPKFMETFHCDGIQVYGMAEGLICWSRWSDPPEIRHKTDGRAVSPDDEIKVVDPETLDEVPVGQIGECWCRGPYTIRGYYREDERNKEAFTPDGYYRTGDLVTLDASGNITWRGRIKDCIDRGGEKINAEEVENYILKYGKVKDVAVVGMPDKQFGERVCAFVVASTGQSFTLEELKEFLLKELRVTPFKVPERLEFIDELPITKIGKYEKKSLREKITQKLKSEGKI